MVTSYLEVHLLFEFQKKGINNIYIIIYIVGAYSLWQKMGTSIAIDILFPSQFLGDKWKG